MSYALTHLAGFGARRAIGGNDSFTTLLLHMDGADASTTFTDSSLSALSLTTVGTAQIDTAQSKFGGASGLFDSAGDYLDHASNAAWSFGTGDYTIDFWLRPAGGNIATGRAVLDIGGGLTMMSVRAQDASTGNGIDVYMVGSLAVSTTDSIAASTWYHVALVRSGSTLKLFVDGIEKASASNSTSISGLLRIGGLLEGGSGSDWNGWLDEVRFSKGIARWTANFTPPAGPYS